MGEFLDFHDHIQLHVGGEERVEWVRFEHQERTPEEAHNDEEEEVDLCK